MCAGMRVLGRTAGQSASYDCVGTMSKFIFTKMEKGKTNPLHVL